MSKGDSGGRDKNKKRVEQALNQEPDREATPQEHKKFLKEFDYDYQKDTCKELNKLIKVTEKYFEGNIDFSVIKNHATGLMVYLDLPEFFYEMGKEYTEALRHIARSTYGGASLEDIKSNLKEKRTGIDTKYQEQMDKHFSRDKGLS